MGLGTPKQQVKKGFLTAASWECLQASPPRMETKVLAGLKTFLFTVRSDHFTFNELDSVDPQVNFPIV